LATHNASSKYKSGDVQRVASKKTKQRRLNKYFICIIFNE